jgi:hypothetical protein
MKVAGYWLLVGGCWLLVAGSTHPISELQAKWLHARAGHRLSAIRKSLLAREGF